MSNQLFCYNFVTERSILKIILVFCILLIIYNQKLFTLKRLCTWTSLRDVRRILKWGQNTRLITWTQKCQVSYIYESESSIRLLFSNSFLYQWLSLTFFYDYGQVLSYVLFLRIWHWINSVSLDFFNLVSHLSDNIIQQLCQKYTRYCVDQQRKDIEIKSVENWSRISRVLFIVGGSNLTFGFPLLKVREQSSLCWK